MTPIPSEPARAGKRDRSPAPGGSSAGDEEARKAPAKKRYAHTLDKVSERLKDATTRLEAEGLVGLGGSTFLCPIMGCFKYTCVCDAVIIIGQTKKLVEHGRRCKGRASRVAAPPPAVRVLSSSLQPSLCLGLIVHGCCFVARLSPQCICCA